jgi:hypothetical protein
MVSVRNSEADAEQTLTEKQKQTASKSLPQKMSFFSCIVDLVEGLLDLLLAPVTVYVHSQHQCLQRGRKTSRKTTETEGISFQGTRTNMAGLLEREHMLRAHK